MSSKDAVIKESTLIAQARWLQVVPVVDKTLLTLLNSELDKGEADAIVLALEQPADRLLLDDTCLETARFA